MERKLVVIAPPESVVPNFDAMDAGIRRFLPRGEPVTVKFRIEWLKELRGGGVLPGDAETAKRAGIPFEQPKASKGKVS